MKVYAVSTEIKGVPHTMSIHATAKGADAGVKQAIADYHPPGARSWQSPNGQWCCEDKEYWVNVYEVLP